MLFVPWQKPGNGYLTHERALYQDLYIIGSESCCNNKGGTQEKMADVPSNKKDDYIVCYAPTMITTNGVWQGDNPLEYSLPLFILQLTLVVVATRIFVFILKPFRQPRVIAEILVSLFCYHHHKFH